MIEKKFYMCNFIYLFIFRGESKKKSLGDGRKCAMENLD